MKILFLSRSTLFDQPGGDTVQVKETAKALEELGVEVEIKLKGESIDFGAYDLVHFFNLGRPADLLPYLHLVRVPIIVSSIFVQYDSGKWSYFKEYAKTLARWLNGSDKYPGLLYLKMRQKKAIQLILDRCVQVITSTTIEKKRIDASFETEKKIKTISLGLSDEYLESFNSDERSGVLMVGRIEKLKNQWSGIQACNGLNIPLKVIGNAAKNQPEYYKKCVQSAEAKTEFIPFLETKELIKAYRKAEVLVLPSLFETFGLVALEAWSQGCKLVLSDKIESREIFKDKAIFFDPTDIDDLKTKLKDALSSDQTMPSNSAVGSHSWKKAAEQLKEIYKTYLS